MVAEGSIWAARGEILIAVAMGITLSLGLRRQVTRDLGPYDTQSSYGVRNGRSVLCRRYADKVATTTQLRSDALCLHLTKFRLWRPAENDLPLPWVRRERGVSVKQ